MSTNQTPNYGLNQWERTDKILMEDFNADNVKLDAALAELAQVTAAHTTELVKRGNVTFGSFTYTGTGTYGEDNPTVITFPKLPAAFVIYGDNLMIGRGGAKNAAHVYSILSGGAGVGTLSTTWSGSKCSIWNAQYPERQMNRKNTEYTVFAFYTL